jgi:hypothetical protein
MISCVLHSDHSPPHTERRPLCPGPLPSTSPTPSASAAPSSAVRISHLSPQPSAASYPPSLLHPRPAHCAPPRRRRRRLDAHATTSSSTTALSEESSHQPPPSAFYITKTMLRSQYASHTPKRNPALIRSWRLRLPRRRRTASTHLMAATAMPRERLQTPKD